MGTDAGGDAIQAGLRVALRAAMKSRDTVATSALRSVLAAIGNAEAVPAPDRPQPDGASQHVAGGTVGLASAEAERKRLTLEETARIVRDEISERQATADQYEAAGRPERAERLRRETQVIQAAIQA